MIQRIQSVYLFLAALCSALCFGLNFAGWENNSQTIGINACRVGGHCCESVAGHPWGIMFFTVLSVVLSLWAIFTYKNRRKQMRMAKAAIWMVLLNYIAIGTYTYTYFTRLSAGAALDIQPGIALPLLTAIFAFLAYRGIHRDDELVRSADRIR